MGVHTHRGSRINYHRRLVVCDRTDQQLSQVEKKKYRRAVRREYPLLAGGAPCLDRASSFKGAHALDVQVRVRVGLIIDHRSRYIGGYDHRQGSLTAGEFVSKYIQIGTYQRGTVMRQAFVIKNRGDYHWKSAPEEDERL